MNRRRICLTEKKHHVIRGIDVGNVNLKITDGNEPYLVPNVMSYSKKAKAIQTGFLTEKDEKNQE